MNSPAISDQIDKILRSQSFASKGQLRKLLQVLLANMDSQATLKPDRVIGELWPEEVKTKRSADVATEMNRLRHALEAYYEEEGKNDPITIILPNRSVTTSDGRAEKRWIAARPRDLAEGPPRVPPAKSHRRLKIISAIASTILLCIAAYISMRILATEKQPQFGRLDGAVLRVTDADGKELWSKSFPDGFSTDWYYAKESGKRIWFADLEGKGHTSVLFSYLAASGPQSQSSTLICYSDRGKEKWRWTPGRDLPELAGSPPTFWTMALEFPKARVGRPGRIVAASIHMPWWPSQIAILDSNGKTVSEYWHSGGLSYLALADLDGDGRQEIIATGVANGYDHQGTLVVLDPDRVSGASTEVRPEFQIHGMGVAHERLRLLFRRSDLNRAMYQYNIATEPTVDQGNIRLTVVECTAPAYGCRIWYEFDKHFRLIAAFAGGDEFRSAHARFYQNGKDMHTLSAGEQAEFQKVRCLVGCKSEFVPVGNLVP
jgi:hypothetical protein